MKRDAFTLVELLVTIGIVAVLLGLALVGVQQAREAARRVSCMNNQRQLGLAVLNYESSHRSLPPAASLVTMNNLGPWAAIGDQLELGGIIRSLDRVNVIVGGPSFPPECSPVPLVLRCPSANPAGCSYRINVGSNPTVTYSHSGVGGGDGPFVNQTAIRLSEISDGLSMTAMIGERISGTGFPGDSAIYYLGAFDPTPSDEDVLAMLRGSFFPSNGCWHAGHQWYAAGLIHSWYTHFDAPNSAMDGVLEGVASANFPSALGSVSARANHLGVVGITFCDGRTEYVSESIDLQVWRSYGNRAGGR